MAGRLRWPGSGWSDSIAGCASALYRWIAVRVEMANRGYLYVEVHLHMKDSPEKIAMRRHRGFQVIDYWVNLVKT